MGRKTTSNRVLRFSFVSALSSVGSMFGRQSSRAGVGGAGWLRGRPLADSRVDRPVLPTGPSSAGESESVERRPRGLDGPRSIRQPARASTRRDDRPGRPRSRPLLRDWTETGDVGRAGREEAAKSDQSDLPHRCVMVSTRVGRIVAMSRGRASMHLHSPARGLVGALVELGALTSHQATVEHASR